MFRKIIFLALMTISTIVAGDSNMGESPLKISVLSTNEVLLNGKPVGPAELSAALATAAKEKGTVWYYRENPAGEPPPASTQVMQMVIDNKLPLSLSTKSDFSDYVDENGNSKPR
jgi:hypothetical protein